DYYCLLYYSGADLF
nr:immunoglobulin light chain junction region [Macaca mulatta]